jgi:hypothetical protein
MKTANEYLENTFKEITAQETFKKWITAKQVSFFVSVCKLIKASHLRGDRTSSSNYVGETDKYTINIYVSPVNNAGSITITNKSLQDEKYKNEFIAMNNEKINELTEKIKQLKADLKEVDKPEEQWDKFDKIYIPKMKKELEQYEKELNSLC